MSTDTMAPTRHLDDDATADRIGQKLAQLLHLPRVLTGPDRGRYRTAWGSKTPAGLARTVARVLHEDAP